MKMKASSDQKILLGKLIKNTREELGLGLRQVAVRADVNWAFLLSLENGDFEASTKNRINIAQVMHQLYFSRRERNLASGLFNKVFFTFTKSPMHPNDLKFKLGNNERREFCISERIFVLR